jgi:hypothetical protein
VLYPNDVSSEWPKAIGEFTVVVGPVWERDKIAITSQNDLETLLPLYLALTSNDQVSHDLAVELVGLKFGRPAAVVNKAIKKAIILAKQQNM